MAPEWCNQSDTSIQGGAQESKKKKKPQKKTAVLSG